jgi:DNA-binding XRE family transcriptional regulator
MVTETANKVATNSVESTFADRMQSAGAGRFSEVDTGETYEVEEVDIPGEVLPGEGLRLSNTRETMPQLIAALRKMQGMTQEQLGEAIGYPANVICHIEKGRRHLGLKTLGDLFNALGGELYIEYRQRQE